MSRTFITMVGNVGADIQDTSTGMQTLIKRYLNKRYMQVTRAMDFEYVNDDYEITTTAGTNKYTLPTDFKAELSVVDKTNNTYLSKISLSDLYKTFTTTIDSTGQPERYIVFTDDANDKKMQFHYTPDATMTISVPYIATPTAMSADADVPVLGLEDLLELGATADAWRYKRQFSKATAMEVAFNHMFQDFIFAQEKQPNNSIQFKPNVADRDGIY